ncbi:MAG: prenyltransferase [Pseudomonadota bacterium]
MLPANGKQSESSLSRHGKPGDSAAWLQAARPAALPMILLPLLLGQGFALDTGATLSWPLSVLAVSFAALFQAYLLYTNDAADAQIDQTNGQYWLSGGSRVVPEGKLSNLQLQRGADVALVMLWLICGYLAVFADRPWMLAALVASVALSWSYHRPPLRLSYRGHGEVVQGLGCGALLPLVGFYLQRGDLTDFPWLSLITLYGFFHAGHIITALPDYASDLVGGKRTIPVRHGQKTARIGAMVLLTIVYASLWLAQATLGWPSIAIIGAPSLLILVGVRLSGLLYDSDVSRFAKCRQFVTWLTISQAWFLFAWTFAVYAGGMR